MPRLFAIGDIHGCYKPFHELVVKIIDLKKTDRLILLGDYIDRGEQSKEVIDFIIDLKAKGFDVTPLSGNHESLLLESYFDPEILPLWFMNNGEMTMQSFGIGNIRDLPEIYLKFFSELEYYISVGNFLFVHAGFNDHEEDPFSDRYHMIWESRLVYENPFFQGKTIIHGHRPKNVEYVQRLIREKSEVIPIDTGCVYEKELGYGFLSALEINTMKLLSIQNS